MLFFSFGNLAFNVQNSEQTIDMIVDSKSKYNTVDEYVSAGIKYLDESVYPGDGIAIEYDGISLKTGKYDEIVNRWIDALNERVEVKIENIQNIYRIKRKVNNPLVDEFIIETDDKFIMFLWATTA
ncbi:MAG: hypothetical protein ACI4DK_10185 [Lachnospiraceae bacterium]